MTTKDPTPPPRTWLFRKEQVLPLACTSQAIFLTQEVALPSQVTLMPSLALTPAMAASCVAPCPGCSPLPSSVADQHNVAKEMGCHFCAWAMQTATSVLVADSHWL